MAVPYTFGNATTSIPLSQLDTNFATAITIGNTAVQLGNTITTMNNLTLANVTVSSGNVTLTSATVPTVIGGTTASSTLTLQSTSGVGTSDAISFKVGNNGATTAMTINTSGNVGIGGAPNSRLTIDSGAAGQMSTYNSTNANGGYITGYSSSTAVWDIGTAKQTFNTGTSTDFGINVRSGFLGFGTATTERMRIDTSGNVGIGTTSPSGKLDVVGGSGVQFNLLNSSDSNRGGRLTTIGTYPSGTFALNTTSSGYAITFGIDSVEKARIDTSGNLLVGTTSQYASSLLSVAGPIAGRSTGVDGTFAPILNAVYSGDITQFGTISHSMSSVATSSGFRFLGGGAGAGTTQEKLLDLTRGRTIFYTGDTERARIDSSGNLLVNTTSADARFVVVDSATSGWGARILKSSATGTPQGLQVVVGQNSSNEVFQCSQGISFTSPTNLFKVQGNGLINTGVASVSPYNNTTGSAANMVVTSAGDLQRSTSSLKYKTDVKDATHGLAEVMQLRPVTYKGKNDGNKVFGGLIAEEVDAVGLTEFVQYAEDGSPDALAYGNMVSLLVKAIQQLKAELDALKGTK